MDFFDVVSKRRSVRRFSPKPVPPEVINRALDAALLAPNSSNLQAWEFVWVRSPNTKARLAQYCFAQNAATTAQELIVAVARLDTWRKHRDAIVTELKARALYPNTVSQYYEKLVPLSYAQDPFGALALIKRIFFSITGLFRPVPRGPCTRAELREVVVKSCALACENLMLALTAQDFASCPMEGFDESRVKRLLGLNRHSRVVMVLGIGEEDPRGVYGQRFRVPREWVIREV